MLALGCRQVVRQRVLVPSFAGSSPAIPARIKIDSKGVYFFTLSFLLCFHSHPLYVIIPTIWMKNGRYL